MNSTAHSAFKDRLPRRSWVIPLCAWMLIASPAAHAQTYRVIHYFTAGSDGANPGAGVTIDRAGNLYGTAEIDGTSQDEGTVYKMTRNGSDWLMTPLTYFGGVDGAIPAAPVVFGPDGALYGTTLYGGAHDAGTVFRLTPPARPCQRIVCPWTKTVLYSFANGDDGARPFLGPLVFDAAGNIYGTTLGRASCRIACGNVFKLTHSGGTWTESVLYTFDDGSDPQSGVIFDNAGNLYGTTNDGGANFVGSVYELSPSGSGWTRQNIYSFSFSGDQDGQHPFGGLTFDSQGNLYGTTTVKGPQGGGTAFELIPSAGNWTFILLHAFTGTRGPVAPLTLDAAGNVYGTSAKTNEDGEVFKLSPSGGGWTYTILHDFSGSDGKQPLSNVSIDTQGNLYGTTILGGITNCFQGCGVVWEITP